LRNKRPGARGSGGRAPPASVSRKTLSVLGRRIVCPHCGAETYERLASYPHCPNCHEYLRKCRYCRKFDFRVYGCTVLELIEEIGRQPDVDEANECPVYDTTLVAEGWTRSLWTSAVRRVSLAVVPAMLLVLLMFLLVPRGPRPGTSELLLTPRLPAEVSVGETLAFDLIINNTTPYVARSVRLWIGSDFLKGFREMRLNPKPQRTTQARNGTWYDLGTLEGNGNLLVTVTAQPRKPGIFRLEAVLIGGRYSKHTAISEAVEVLP